MTGWLDKAKEAAAKAAEEAKKLAEKAKNANYGEMINKTKDMATHAAEEAKKAAGNMMHKDTPPTTPDIIPAQDNPQATQSDQPNAMPIQKEVILAKLAQVNQLLKEIEGLLK